MTVKYLDNNVMSSYSPNTSEERGVGVVYMAARGNKKGLKRVSKCTGLNGFR